MQPHDTTNEIPYGYCHCGCGEKTNLAKTTDSRHGHNKGEPLHYLRGHATNKHLPNPNPGGLCMCGCGQPTSIAKRTNSRSHQVKGFPIRFLPGHGGKMKAVYRPAENRFWEKVIKGESDNCWLWTGAKSDEGYGSFYIDSKSITAHRFSYQLHYDLVTDGLWVLHRCDNPSCVNPKHLFLGTHQDNMADMVAKGRAVSVPRLGEDHAQSRLINEQVMEIRKLCASGVSQQAVADKYGIAQTTVSKIVRRTRWKHI